MGVNRLENHVIRHGMNGNHRNHQECWPLQFSCHLLHPVSVFQSCDRKHWRGVLQVTVVVQVLTGIAASLMGVPHQEYVLQALLH
jgi:hypothetical protein